jgi:hypothetical protein
MMLEQASASQSTIGHSRVQPLPRLNRRGRLSDKTRKGRTGQQWIVEASVVQVGARFLNLYLAKLGWN